MPRPEPARKEITTHPVSSPVPTHFRIILGLENATRVRDSSGHPEVWPARGPASRVSNRLKSSAEGSMILGEDRRKFMKRKVLTYSGDKLTVHYDVARCIHAAECVRGLPRVFDPNRKPWVAPDEATPEDVLRVVSECPTGALHAARQGNDTSKRGAERNTARIEPDGPLYASGDIEIKTARGEVVLRDTRVALCRCGASRNKPLCDGAHAKAGFSDAGELGKTGDAATASEAGKLIFVALPDGPLLFEGSCELAGSDGRCTHASKGALCRCGASTNKPFCDGSHTGIGFLA